MNDTIDKITSEQVCADAIRLLADLDKLSAEDRASVLNDLPFRQLLGTILGSGKIAWKSATSRANMTKLVEKRTTEA